MRPRHERVQPKRPEFRGVAGPDSRSVRLPRWSSNSPLDEASSGFRHGVCVAGRLKETGDRRRVERANQAGFAFLAAAVAEVLIRKSAACSIFTGSSSAASQSALTTSRSASLIFRTPKVLG